jgi:hypothetical protein
LYNRPEVAAVPSGLSPTPLIIKIHIKHTVFEYSHALHEYGIVIPERVNTKDATILIKTCNKLTGARGSVVG